MQVEPWVIERGIARRMSNRILTSLFLFFWIVDCAASACAEDWPTFMHDNHRTGVTSESLRPPLQPCWVFESPFPPAKGWALPVNGYGARKNKPNVSYDDAFRVIAVGDSCYFCSSADNRVYAVDAATGTVKWTYFTDASPRLAPAYWRGKLYVGADDGILRCLDARDGTLRWQIRAAPRPDLVLGQGRFNSAWPIRAAGMVEDGVVYFTAGLFPYQHLYFYAVDAEDGSVRWCEQLDEGGRLDHVPQGHLLATKDSLWTTSRATPARWRKSDGRRIDFHTPFPQTPKSHEYRFYNGGTYAQISNGQRIVYGRACILAYDPEGERKDRWGRTQKGELLFNWFNARQALFQDAKAYLATDYHVLAVEQDRLADLSNNECREFEETYKRFTVANYLDLRDRYDGLVRQHGEDHPSVRALKQGPLRWKAKSWQQWQKERPTLFEKFRRKCVWMTPLKATEALVLAGDVIYAGGEDRVVALDASDGRPLWDFTTGSRVRGLAVANRRLYVSSVDGTVRCFVPAAGTVRPAHRVRIAAEIIPAFPTAPGSFNPKPEAPAFLGEFTSFGRNAHADQSAVGARLRLNDGFICLPILTRIVKLGRPSGEEPSRMAQVARRLADQTVAGKGYCLILGAAATDLAVEIAGITDFRVELLAADAARVQPMREDVAAQGLYGGRICVRHCASDELPYPPYVFNLVIDQGSFATGKPSVPVEKAFGVTKPCGGVLVLGKPDDVSGRTPDVATTLGWDLQSLQKAGGAAQQIGDLLTITRGPIPQAADWTHNYANAANTYCSEDPHVKGPFGLLWYGEPGPRKRIDRHATPPMPLVVSGVMFTIGNDLVGAYDVYNGVPYWEREIPGATRRGLPINTSNLAADDRSLFVAIDGGNCWRLDARSGETLKTYSVPPGNSSEQTAWAWIATDGNLLYGSQAEYDQHRRRVSEQTSARVFALEKDTGRLVWTYEGQGIDHDGSAVAAGKVFLTDRALTDAQREQALATTAKDPSVADRQPIDRHGKPIPPDLRKLVALDASSGAMLWQRPLDVTDVTLDDMAVQGKGGVACMAKNNVVVMHGVGSLGHPHKEFLAGQFARRALYAFDGTTGKPLWGGRKGYRKRPIIVGEYVYAEPFAWHLRTGIQKKVRNPLSGRLQPLDFHRGYIGCGHILASASTLFGAKSGIGYYNLDQQCGFTPFGGVNMACGLGAVPAGGVFVAPEGRSGCTCDAPIHASLTLYPKPKAEAWSIGVAGGRAEVASLPVRNVSVNLGAPGYREDSDGNLWIPYPARVDTGLLGDWLPTYQHDPSMCYRMNELGTTVAGTNSPWIFTSGYTHEKPLKFRLVEEGQPPCTYTVRLFFTEPEDIEAGKRVFSVQLQGKTVLQDFDVAEAAGGPRRAVIKEFPEVVVRGELEIRLLPADHTTVKSPVLSGFQALRSSAKCR